MDKEQAKLILGCARPNGADDADPAVREALDYVQADPGLKAWLDAERSMDHEVSRHVLETAVPASLRQEILERCLEGKVIPIWRRPQVWAVAACALVLVGWALQKLSFNPDLPAASYADMQHDIGSLVAGGGFTPNHAVPGTLEARQWLAEKKAPSMDDLPPFLAGTSAVACSVIEWRGRKVGGMCLQKDGRLMHLFVISREQLDSMPPEGKILTQTYEGHQSLAWNSPKHFYVLVADKTTTDLSTLPGGS